MPRSQSAASDQGLHRLHTGFAYVPQKRTLDLGLFILGFIAVSREGQN